MKKSRILTLLLTAALLTQLIACQNNSDNPPPTNLTDVDQSDSLSADTGDGFALPDINWDGREFRVLGYDCVRSNFNTFEIYAESENGDVVNDAIYRRNATIEDKYNVKITEIINPDSNSADWNICNSSVIRKTAISGDDLYDLAFNTVCSIGTLARENLLYDLNTVDYIDFDASWWNKQANKNVSMMGKQYFASNDFSLRDKDRVNIGLYNREMVDSYNLGNPIELVREGKWTLDVLTEWALQVSNDLNGNGEVDDTDQFGICCSSFDGFQAFLTGCNCQVMTKDSSDMPIITLNTEHMTNSIDKVLEFAARKDVTLFCEDWVGKVDYDYWSTASKNFKSGHSLFVTTNSRALAGYSAECTVDYGIIPYPKYDENQENYYSLGERHCMLFCIPISCNDPDFTGFMLEALAHEATDTSLKAYYEISCKTKYTYDEDSAEMLDLIYSGIIYDIARIYSINGISDIIYNIAMKRSNTVVSDYASNESKAKADIDKLIEDLSE
ncbi:MAG: hypothetical protein HFE63_08240 [Clostridiales bacterium]|nr:hypothetical protein [Clostridiales bacterium]